MEENIRIQGARVNNLKNISLEIPRDKLIVVTGLSGSGKSSLAFDTLYAEGQRRYVESLSAYARQFLGRMNKPDCDLITGLPPAIAIERKSGSRNPRSTVGTSSEIYDYLRMLFARVGKTFSPLSGCEVKRFTLDDILAEALSLPEETPLLILCPLILRESRTIEEQIEIYLQEGYSRLEIDGQVLRMEACGDVFQGAKQIYLLIDRLRVRRANDTVSRLVDSLETALAEGEGQCFFRNLTTGRLSAYSTRFEADGLHFLEPSDEMFAFNSSMGACPKCEGIGVVTGIDERKVIPDTSKSIYDGAVVCWRGEKMSLWKSEFIRRNSPKGFPIFEPYNKLSEAQKEILWEGSAEEQAKPEEDQVSIQAFFRMVERNCYKIQYRVMQARYRGRMTCPLCHGGRLRKEATYVRIGGKTLPELVKLPIHQLFAFFEDLQLNATEARVGKRLLTEIRSRLNFLIDVGLPYLTLDRTTATLSTGEVQRINLATQIGSALVGSLYILDEPSIGLHPRDTARLISTLKRLRDVGNTVIVVEHDEEIIREADFLIDIGPEAGERGGQIMYVGSLENLPRLQSPSPSHTLNYLLSLEQIPIPPTRRVWNNSIKLVGCRENNLKDIDVEIPLNVLTVVTGVSGSGKTTLVRDLLYRGLKRLFDEPADAPGEFSSLEGSLHAIEAVEFINQQPIGKSSRSNPVTYVKAYDEIRKLFSEQPLAQSLGLSAAHFSFNAEEGRCENCKGEGTVKVPMQFMADMELECEECHGRRFKQEVLDVRFQGLCIHDILQLTVDEAIEFFHNNGKEKIVRALRPLQQVGLGYIRLGQSSSTLSGGENQRVKLAYYLTKEKQVPTLFIFDEPTTGLHFHDIKRLLDAFNRLIERGHSLVVIEHNLEVIKSADHLIDLGPEGGEAGGNLVVFGTPEQVVASGKGHTAFYLRPLLAGVGLGQA